MNKKRILLFASICILLTSVLSIVAFADGEYDTPTIPLHTKHTYYLLSGSGATCTESGTYTYKCRGCTKTYTENVDALGHMFSFDSCISEDEVELYCPYCKNYYEIASQELSDYWNISFINDIPERTAKSDSGYLDLDGNGIINAKDYSIIAKAANGGF